MNVGTFPGMASSANSTIVAHVPLGGYVPMSTVAPSPLVVEGSFTYMKTGFTDLAANYPNMPAALTGPAFDWVSQGIGTFQPFHFHYIGSRFVAVNGTAWWHSTDEGANWNTNTALAITTSNNNTASLVANGVLIILQTGAYGGIRTSDGVTWTTFTLPQPASNVQWTQIAHSGTRWMASNTYGDMVYSDNDGVSWTQTTSTPNAGATQQYALGYVGGLFVALHSTNVSYTSTNGAAWTTRTPGITVGQNQPASGNGVMIILSTSQGVVIRTTDGITFSNVGLPSASAAGSSLIFANGIFMWSGYNGTTLAVSTGDGLLWTVRTGVTGSNSSRLAANSNVFLLLESASYNRQKATITLYIINTAVTATGFSYYMRVK